MIRLKVKKDDLQIIELMTLFVYVRRKYCSSNYCKQWKYDQWWKYFFELIKEIENKKRKRIKVEARSVVEALLCRSPRDQVDLPYPLCPFSSFLLFFLSFFDIFHWFHSFPYPQMHHLALLVFANYHGVLSEVDQR